MRNIRSINWSVDQLKNLIDFLRTVEPLLKSSVPQAIGYLDRLEHLGTFQLLAIFFGRFFGLIEGEVKTFSFIPPSILLWVGGMLAMLLGFARSTIGNIPNYF